jgi:hypothetical protein
MRSRRYSIEDHAMTPAGRSGAVLGIGRVVYFTLQILRAHLLPFSGLGLLAAASVLVMRYLEAVLPDETMFTSVAMALSVAGYVICDAVLTAAITMAIVPDETGELPPLSRCVSAVANDLAALSAIAIVSFVLFFAGYAFLVLPGLFIGAVLAVVIPVRILEKRSIVQTFVRSIQLTRGNWWPIFGLLLALFVTVFAGEAAVNVMVGDPILAGYSGEPQSASAFSIIGSTVVELIASLVNATATAVVYIELRHIKDGPGPAMLASEFD